MCRKDDLVGLSLEPEVSPWRLPLLNSHPHYRARSYHQTLYFDVLVKQGEVLMILVLRGAFERGGAFSRSLSATYQKWWCIVPKTPC